MLNYSLPIKNILKRDVTTLAHLFKIIKKSGEEVLVTSHDRNIRVGNDIYHATSGIAPVAQMMNTIDTGGNTSEIRGLLGDTDITEFDIDARNFSGARVERYMVDWANPDKIHILESVYFIGKISRGNKGKFSIELLSNEGYYENPLTERTSYYCRAELGDRRCGINLSPTTTFSFQKADISIIANLEVKKDVWYLFNEKIYVCIKAGVTDDLTDDERLNLFTTVITQRITDGTAQFKFIDFPLKSINILKAKLATIIPNYEGKNFPAIENYIVLNEILSNVNRNSVYTNNIKNTYSAILTTSENGIMGSYFLARIVSGLGPSSIFLIKFTKKIGASTYPTFSAHTASDPLIVPSNTFDPKSHFKSNNNLPFEIVGVPVIESLNTNVSQQNPKVILVNPSKRSNGKILMIDISSKATPLTKKFLSRLKGDVGTGKFLHGLVEFYDGYNPGFKTEIQRIIAEEDFIQVTLFQPPPNGYNENDTIILYYGCDKLLSTCVNTFNNQLNFRGEPFTPGYNAYLNTFRDFGYT